ncbi:MAG: phosphatase PAP2 family protein [Candidatus Micrarchaeia archaeon]
MQPAFDAITRAIAGIDSPVITVFSYFLDYYAQLLFILPILYLMFAVVRGRLGKRRLSMRQVLARESTAVNLVLAMALSLGIAFAIKYFAGIPRPCAIDPSYTVYTCPDAPDTSFPSGHSTIAATLLASQLGSPAFPLFFVLNLMIGFSRINLGVHFLNDVLAGFVIGFFSYDIVSRLRSRGTLSIHKPEPTDTAFEFRRQLLHVTVGLVLVAALQAFSIQYGDNGRIYLEFVIFAGLQAILLLMNHWHTTGGRGVLRVLLGLFERRGSRPGYGAFWYGMGILFAFVFLSSKPFLAATIIALGVGDGVATMAGVYGTHINPFNRSKTVEGTLAFFASVALLSLMFLEPWLAITIAAITAAVESLPPKFDDNFTVPLACILLYFALSAAGILV